MASGGAQGDKPILKIIVMGDSHVGKSTIVDIYLTGTPYDCDTQPERNFDTPPEVRIHHKDVVVLGESYILEIHDMAGRDPYRKTCTSSYPGAHAGILMFDIGLPDSYAGLARWQEEIKPHVLPSFPFIFFGNKYDHNIPVQRASNWDPKVSGKQVCAVRDTNRMPYFETTYLDINRINLAFEAAIVKARDHWLEKKEQASDKKEKRKSGCFPYP